MPTTHHRVRHRARFQLLGLVALTLAAACDSSDKLSPSSETPVATTPSTGDSAASVPSDSSATPIDSTSIVSDSTAVLDSTGAPVATSFATGTQPGIVFGSYGMTATDLNSIHTGILNGGGITETNVGSLLAAIKAKGGRLVLKMCMGDDKYVKNPDGTFSLTKWKSLVDRFKQANLGPYISDGTLIGHFLIDEPQRTAKWGGKIISQATIEAMAQYSKTIWPTLPTFVRVVPSWLASAPVTYRALDAGWLQYGYGKGDPGQMVASETAIAKNKGLGLLIGLNILDGGNGSSGVHGWSKNKWTMSASEIKNYGTALLNNSYACGFYNWTYQYFGPTYYARSDVKSAMTTLSGMARNHARTSCRQ
ncbi:MAG TPA: hypothetical protein VIG95_04950 [Gemmatimonadales bacterium]